MLGPSVPEGRSCSPLSSKAGPGRDHLASCGKGLPKSPPGELPELPQLLWGCKHTSTHEDATHCPEKLCPWDLGSWWINDNHPGNGSCPGLARGFHKSCSTQGKWCSHQPGGAGEERGECSSKSSHSLLALKNPAHMFPFKSRGCFWRTQS